MQISRKKKGKNRIIEVKGSLTIAGSNDLKKAVVADLVKGSRLELVLADVTEVDLSFIQIVAAAMKKAEKGDREFMIRTPIPEKVVEGVRLSGLLNHNRCSRSNCVWCAINEQVT